MKLQCKQLDVETSNYIATALEHYAEYLWNRYNIRADFGLELAILVRKSIPLLVTEEYSNSNQ